MDDQALIRTYGNKNLPEGTADRPLVTFALFAYNQEKYIREAVEGAFSQTYSPLEIILSDDCSSDRTFEIMEEMAREYRGPHRIICRRSAHNFGFGAHIKGVIALVRTEWIVVAAGDDISLPERTSVLSECWKAGGPPVCLVHSACERISGEGALIGVEQSRYLRELQSIQETLKSRAFVVGATAAWNRRLFEDFGEISDDLMLEDQVLQIRAQLLGRISYSDRPLIKYRLVGITSEYSKQSLAQRFFGISNDRLWNARRQQYEDMRVFGCDDSDMGCIAEQLDLTEFRRVLGRSRFFGKIKATQQFIKKGGKIIDVLKNLSLSLFPRTVEALFAVALKAKR